MTKLWEFTEQQLSWTYTFSTILEAVYSQMSAKSNMLEVI